MTFSQLAPLVPANPVAVQTGPNIIDIHSGWGASPAAPHWNDVTAISTEMRARGVKTCFVSSVLARRYDLPAGNEALAGAIGESQPEGQTDVRGWFVIHPARADECIKQMRRLLYSPRFVGAALYADPQTQTPVSVTDAHDLVTAFRRYGKPLLVETPTASAMAEAVRIADDLGSRVTVIASGMGGNEWREALALAAHTNLYFDISGALVPEKIEYAHHILHGVRKLLFASGAPYTDPAAVAGLLADVRLTPEERARILTVNAERMFGLGAAPVKVDDTPPDEGPANYLVGNAPEDPSPPRPRLTGLASLGGPRPEEGTEQGGS